MAQITLCQDCANFQPSEVINGATVHNVCGKVLDTIQAPETGEAAIENNAYAQADAVLKVSPTFGCVMGEPR